MEYMRQVRKRQAVERMEMMGRRVQLIHCSDPYTLTKPGSLGTVQFVDDLNTVHVRWDDGSTIGMLPGEDSFILV
jgi:hypothetical protein